METTNVTNVDERNRKIDEYLANPRAKTEVLLKEMEKKSGKSREELIWIGVQLLAVRQDKYLKPEEEKCINLIQ